ncbi:MAG: HAMP domain-containing histidine kinase [Steroidobacteraceae bacterium]|nr:HAMP domain-containing histidine kinase [Steroidobacteraceae bacterium]MDW8259544.1 HAMP domain-containing sensor histidine kinase [Gammaproteobacteria bacterium]
MRWLRPKSLSGLILLGLILIAVPLLAAIINAAVTMRELTLTSQELVRQSVQTARLTQELTQVIGALDRTTRLLEVLGDPKLMESYRRNDQRLTNVQRELSQLLRDAQNQATLRELSELQSIVRRNFSAPQITGVIASNLLRLEQMATLAESLAIGGNRTLDMAVRQLQSRTVEARRQLLWQASLLVPLVIAVVGALTWLVARPLGQIDRAISELGRGDFSRPIAVKGPSDLEKLGGQLEWLRVRLAELAEERSRFLRHMSHELKTPLANIREGTDLLMEGAVGRLDGPQREVTSILRENGLRLQRLIENLLSYTAWQSQNSKLELSEFTLRSVIKQALENHQLTILSQRLRLDVKVGDVVLYADRAKLRLIIDNLLSNAIKYSPKGGTIFVRGDAVERDIVIDVADCGGGIAPEERARIFEAFYTGRAPQGGRLRGTGIGLSVVMEFVNAHGGTIQIVDGEYPGAHFRVRMPQRIRTEGGLGAAA